MCAVHTSQDLLVVAGNGAALASQPYGKMPLENLEENYIQWNGKDNILSTIIVQGLMSNM